MTDEFADDEESDTEIDRVKSVQLLDSIDKFSLTNMEELMQVNAILATASQEIPSDNEVKLNYSFNMKKISIM